MVPTPSTSAPAGWFTTVRASINAGAFCGLFQGLADGLVASSQHSLGVLELVGCVAASVLVYGLVWTALLVLASPLTHLWVRRFRLGSRTGSLLGLALGGACFLELYWWTRPFLFYGHSALSPERLIAAGLQLLLGLGLGYLGVRLLARLSRLGLTAIAFSAMACWLGGFLFLVQQEQAAKGGQRGELNQRNRDLPNVVLVVVDALRADVLGAYGNREVKTPVLDQLAREGVLFQNAMAQAPFTWSSFGSILTGKYPRRHGLVKQAIGQRMLPNITMPLHLKSAPRLAGDHMQDQDYLGGTFMTGALSHGSGLMQGFDVYFEAMMGHDLVSLDSSWSVFRSDLLLSIVKNKLTQRFDTELVMTTAREWLHENKDRRFVSMVHLYSTHTPYDPPQKYKDMYCDPAYAGPIHAFYAEHRYAIEDGKYVPTQADIQQIKNLYYAGVSQADAMIGDLLAELERAGVREDTLLIVTADHGEELHDHGLWEHNWMYQTNLHVPLIVSWPGHLPSGEVEDALVESIDILPTLCELFGLELPLDASQGERGKVDGHSLLPLLRGEQDQLRSYSFGENNVYIAIQDHDWKLIVRHDTLSPANWAAMWTETAALRGKPFDPDWTQAELQSLARIPKLFHLAEDPGEHYNAIAEQPVELARLLEALRAHDARMPIPAVDVVQSFRDLENQALLDRLGYMESSGEEPVPVKPSEGASSKQGAASQ